MVNRKLVSGIVLAVMTIGLFGGFYVARATTITAVKAGYAVWTVLNPLPKVVSSDNRTLYVVFIPQISNGTAPYTVTVTIQVNGGSVDTYAHYTSESAGVMFPIIWSESATHSPTTLAFQLLVQDSAATSAYFAPSIHIPAF